MAHYVIALTSRGVFWICLMLHRRFWFALNRPGRSLLTCPDRSCPITSPGISSPVYRRRRWTWSSTGQRGLVQSEAPGRRQRARAKGLGTSQVLNAQHAARHWRLATSACDVISDKVQPSEWWSNILLDFQYLLSTEYDTDLFQLEFQLIKCSKDLVSVALHGSSYVTTMMLQPRDSRDYCSRGLKGHRVHKGTLRDVFLSCPFRYMGRIAWPGWRHRHVTRGSRDYWSRGVTGHGVRQSRTQSLGCLTRKPKRNQRRWHNPVFRRSWLVIWKTKQNDRKSKSRSGALTHWDSAEMEDRGL